MNRVLRRAAVAAGSLGVVGGIALTALPASAAPDPVAAWGAAASGLINIAPVAFATSFDTPGVASNANFTNFLTTGLIIDRASFTTGYSLVNSPVVNLAPILPPSLVPMVAGFSASKVTSWCHVFPDGDTVGGASIFSGTVTAPGTSYDPLTNGGLTKPAPNTVIDLYDSTGTLFGSVTLNKQVTLGSQLTVTAVYISAGPETLSLGVSTCGGGVG